MGLAKNVAGFLLGFLLLVLGRHALVPSVPRPLAKATAKVIAERASCSVLFIGPSYVAEGIVPEAFDREAERIGFDAHACKYGTTGLKGYELRMWIERFLAYDWPKLRFVVIDITLGDRLGFESENWLKPRVVEWHTWSAVPWLFEHYRVREPLPTSEKIPRLYAHARHVAAHYLELGQGVEALGSLRLVDRQRSNEPTADARRTRERGEGATRKPKRTSLAYATQLARLEALKRARRSGSSDWAVELRSAVRAHGKEAYFLIAPVLYSSAIPARAFVGNDPLVVLDFNDPRRYPELYREEARGNTSHLRGEGRIAYSELLARELGRLEPRRRR